MVRAIFVLFASNVKSAETTTPSPDRCRIAFNSASISASFCALNSCRSQKLSALTMGVEARVLSHFGNAQQRNPACLDAERIAVHRRGENTLAKLRRHRSARRVQWLGWAASSRGQHAAAKFEEPA